MAARALLLDIEGTTTPISFVHDVLFPYIRKELAAHLAANWADAELKEDVRALCEQSKKDMAGEPYPAIVDTAVEDTAQASVVANVLAQMDVNRKSTALKRLQGHMWRRGYTEGKLLGEVYDDVLPALRRYQEAGIPIFIYSSGSVEAQKLLFGYSDKGSLLQYFKGHFDTNVGLKVEAASYSAIATDIGVEPASILFVTDVLKEAVAAAAAGVQVIISVRDGNAPLPADHGFRTITSFDALPAAAKL